MPDCYKEELARRRQALKEFGFGTLKVRDPFPEKMIMFLKGNIEDYHADCVRGEMYKKFCRQKFG